MTKPFITRTYLASLIRSGNNPVRAAFLFGFAAQASWMPLFNLWLEEQGLTGVQIGYVAAIPWALMLVLQPLWGVIADRYGKLRCLRLSLVLASASFIIFPALSGQISTIALLTTVMSVFNTPVLPLLDSIALDHAAYRPGISYSNIRFWGAPGYGLGALVTGWLTPVFGREVAFYASAGFLVLTLLSSLVIVLQQTRRTGPEVSFRDAGKLLHDRFLLIFLLFIVLVSIGQSAITFFLSLYMRDIGATPEITGTAISMEGISELPFYFIAAWLLRRMKPGRVVLIAVAGTVLRLSLYALNNNPGAVIGIECMNGITWTLLWIASVEFVNERIPAKWRTTGQSLLWAAYYGAGYISGNLINGWLYQQVPMKQVYTCNAIMVLLTGMAFLLVFRSGSVKNKSIPYENPAA